MQSLLAQVQLRNHAIAFKQALIDKLTHEMAILKRMKFAATSERFASTLSPEQRSLFASGDQDPPLSGGEVAVPLQTL